MQKMVVLIILSLMTFSLYGQDQKNRSALFSKVSKQKELSVLSVKDRLLNIHSKNKQSKQVPYFKDVNAIKQRLDSVVAPEIDKEVYFYDTNGNMIQNIYLEWEENHWKNTARYDNSFDASGNLVKNVTTNWENDQWVNFMKEEYTFDEKGNKTQSMTFLWTNNEWVNIYQKEEYTFDAHGNQTQHVTYDWVNGQYRKSRKEEFVFDENGAQIQNTKYVWDGSQWLNWLKDEFTFDSSGNQIQSINYNWDNDLWVNSSKIENLFDTNGNNTQIIGYGWDGYNWYYTEKYETIYDTNENITRLVYYEWNSTEWIVAARYEYQYDAGGNVILSDFIFQFENQAIIVTREESAYDGYGNRTYYVFLSIDFESEDFNLLPILKQESVYDNSFSFEDLILPFTPEDFENDIEGELGQINLNLLFKHKLTNILNYEHDGDNWLLVGNYTLFYTEQNITVIDELNLADNVNVYPNPASNQVTFNIATAVEPFNVEFYDLQGKLVLNRMVFNNRPFSIESLNRGLYFYRLFENQNIYTGKIILK